MGDLEFLCRPLDMLACRQCCESQANMLDLIFLAAGTAFFAMTATYADGCDRV